jgi:predicted HAD superfamily Cof-like phosphohydrolase
MRLYDEEISELKVALDEYNLLESFDALADIMYIYMGNNIENVSEVFDKDPVKIYEDYINFKKIIDNLFNIKIEDSDFLAIFIEVHKSNMSKLDENGNPVYREDGKIIKSNLFFKPNISNMQEYKKYLI